MEMVLRMRETADDIRAENPSTVGFGTGRLDLARALSDPPTSVVRRTGGRTVGPAVVLPTRSGAPRVAVVTNNSRLLIVDGAGGDTLVNVALPGRPQRQLAAADLGGGHGVALVVSTTNNAVAAFHPSGVPLAGLAGERRPAG